MTLYRAQCITDKYIRIIEGPTTINNARVNSEVSFTCEVEGTNEHPSWNIDGIEYFTAELPPNFSFSQGKLKIVITTVKLNRTLLYCFYAISPLNMIKSQNASLFITEGKSVKVVCNYNDKGYYLV